jgi:hypothetical protein
MSVIPATQEMEAGGSRESRSTQVNKDKETLPQKPNTNKRAGSTGQVAAWPVMLKTSIPST